MKLFITAFLSLLVNISFSQVNANPLCGTGSVNGAIGTAFTYSSAVGLNAAAHVNFSNGATTVSAASTTVNTTTDVITFKAPTVLSTGTYTVSIYRNSANTSPICAFTFVYVSLPIELVNFKAISYEKNISLQWNTAEEKNVNFFSIERSKNGRDFKELAKVKTGSESKEYSFTDEKPFVGTSYYRLAMAENDGSATNYSKTLSVVMSTRGVLKLTPMISSSAVTIDLPDNLGEVTLNITDFTGKVIRSFKTSSIQETVNVSDLANGMYFIVAQSGTDKFSERFVKQ